MEHMRTCSFQLRVFNLTKLMVLFVDYNLNQLPARTYTRSINSLESVTLMLLGEVRNALCCPARPAIRNRED